MDQTRQAIGKYSVKENSHVELSYVAGLVGPSLDFDTLKNYDTWEELPEHSKNTIVEMGMEADFQYAFIIQSNGFGAERGSMEACQNAVSSWEGFASWNLSDALDYWGGLNNYL